MAQSKQPIGITFPIARGMRGYFNQSFDVLEQVSANLYLLLSTRKGERRLNLEFGSSLWEIIFKFNNDEIQGLAESAIKKDVEKWLPYINIKGVSVKSSDLDKDNYTVNISVTFTAENVGIVTPQNLSLVAQQGNI